MSDQNAKQTKALETKPLETKTPAWVLGAFLWVLSLGLMFALVDMIVNRFVWLSWIFTSIDKGQIAIPGADWRSELMYQGKVLTFLFDYKYNIGDQGALIYLMIVCPWILVVATFRSSWNRVEQGLIAVVMIASVATSLGLLLYQSTANRQIDAAFFKKTGALLKASDFLPVHGFMVKILGKEIDMTVQDPAALVFYMAVLAFVIWMLPGLAGDVRRRMASKPGSKSKPTSE